MPRPNNFASANRSHRIKLIDFLKHAGYVEKSQQADKARGRYSVGDGNRRR